MLQPVDGLEIDAAVSHRQIRSLDQGESQVAGNIRVFKVSFVVRSGSEQNDSWVVAVGEVGEGFALGAEEGGEAQYVRATEQVRQDVGDDGAVLDRVAAARRRLGAIGQHPPLAVRRTRQIDGHHMQIAVGGNPHSYQWAKEGRVRVEKCSRKMALRHQILGPVKILEQQAEQLGALDDARFDESPLLGRNQQRKDIDLPGSIGSKRIAVNVVRDSVLANPALGPRPAASELLGTDRLKLRHQVGPVPPGSHSIGRHLVIASSVAQRSLIQVDRHGRSPDFSRVCGPLGGNRRSSVRGKIGLVSSFGAVIGPGTGSDT